MRRPSLLKSKITGSTGESQVVEFALDQSITVESGTDAGLSDDPPEGGYGWVVCGAVALINGFTWGVAAVCLYHPYQMARCPFVTDALMLTASNTVLRRLPLLLPLKLTLPYRNAHGLRFHRRPHLRLRATLQPSLDNLNTRSRPQTRHDRRLFPHGSRFHRCFFRHRALAIVPLARCCGGHGHGRDLHPQRASRAAVVSAAA